MLLGLGIFTVFALLVVATGLIYYWVKVNSLDRVDVALASAAANQPENFLLVGSDTRDIPKGTPDAAGIFGKGDAPDTGGQRADTIVIARIDPKRTSIELLSIPRDLIVTKPNSTTRTKINATYNSGPQDLIDAIHSNLGLDINHYVEVNFESFKGLVQAIGGVHMYFGTAMYDRNTGLAIRHAGCYNLDPVQALAFARSRHLRYSDGTKWVSDPTADLGRITRQQVFLRRALAKISTLGITDFATLNSLVDVAISNVKVDSALGTSQMISLARKFSKFDSKTLVTHRLPTVVDGSNLEIDSAASESVLDIFRGKSATRSTGAAVPTTTAIPNAAITVSVMNGTGTAGLAANAGKSLASMSFNLGSIANATPSPSSTVFYAKSDKATAEAVASHVSPEPTLTLDPSLTTTNVRLVLGADYREVLAHPAGSTATATPSAGGATSTSLSSDPTANDKPVGYTTGDPPPGVKCAA